MSYLLKESAVDDVKFLTVENSGTGEFVKISLSHGGTVVQALLMAGEKLHNILAPDLESDFISNPLFRGRILFPFNDRIPDAAYTFGGRSFNLPINCDDGSSIHGMVYNRPFEQVDFKVKKDSATLVLSVSIDRSDYEGYPFDATLRISYTLSKGTLELNFDVLNEGSEDLPFALGWHPYFKTDNSAVISGRYKSYVEVDKELIPTGSNIDVKGSDYDFKDGWNVKDRELDLGFEISDGVTSLKTKDYTLDITQDPEFFPYTQMYIPEDFNSVAIEPITAATNSFNIQSLGLVILQPGESKSGKTAIKIS